MSQPTPEDIKDKVLMNRLGAMFIAAGMWIGYEGVMSAPMDQNITPFKQACMSEQYDASDKATTVTLDKAWVESCAVKKRDFAVKLDAEVIDFKRNMSLVGGIFGALGGIFCFTGYRVGRERKVAEPVPSV